MNTVPDWAMWQSWLLRLGLGVTIVIAFTGLIAHFCASGVRQRMICRGGFLALALFLVCECAGVSGLLALISDTERAAFGLPNDGLAQPAGEGGDGLVVRLGSGAVASGPTAAPIWWPGMLWLGGAALWLSRSFVFGTLLLLWRRRHCKAIASEILAERVRTIGGKLGLRRSPKIMETSDVLAPAVAGFWRPTLILPLRFAEDFEPAKQEAMLAHELAHIAGRDPLWQTFADGIVALLWWQPLVWWARHRFRTANEAAADEASCIVADGPALLAACLVEVGGKLTRAPRSGWLGMAGAGFRSSLGRRVERLLTLKPSAPQPSRRFRSRVLLTLLPALLTAGAVFSIAWAQPLQGDSTMSTKATWKRSLAGVVLCTTFGIGAEASAQQKPQPPAGLPGVGIGDGPAGIGIPEGEDGFVLKVFKLKHRDPEVVINVANRLVSARSGMPGVGAEGASGPGGLPPGPGIGAPGPGGGIGLGARGGRGGFPGGEGGAGGGSLLRVAADKRTRTLIARGPAEEVQMIADLVAIIDVQDGQVAPKARNLRVFRLKHADARTILGILDTLALGGVATELDRNGLIVMGEGAVMRQIAEVIQLLDVESEAKTTK